MKKIKEEKGITLVALIITIVVLLILAAVAIGTVKNSDIIGHAQNAAGSFNQSKDNEVLLLEKYENEIEDKLPKQEEGLIGRYETLLGEQMGIGPWKLQEDGTIKNGKTEETKKIGDTFTNDEVLAATGGTKSSYTGTWTILGVEENGRLKLVSTTNVITTSVILGEDDPEVYVKDENGNPTTTLRPEIVEIFDKAGEETNLDVEKAIWSYQHAVETLDGYAKKTTGIESARSIKIEDLEAKDVLNIDNAKKIELSYYDYGTTYNYFYNTDKTKVSSKNKAPGSETWSSVSTSEYDEAVFVDKEGNTVVVDSEYKGEGVELDSTYYNRYIFTDEQKKKYANSLATGSYWLASPCVSCYTSQADFYMRYVSSGGIGGAPLLRSYGYARGCVSGLGVRAVVYI